MLLEKNQMECAKGKHTRMHIYKNEMVYVYRPDINNKRISITFKIKG